jgi:hypothetical protein
MNSRLWNRVREYVSAVRDYPRGAFCEWCGRLNLFCDDIGFHWITPKGDEGKVCCRRCYEGPLGRAHVARYGMGDR